MNATGSIHIHLDGEEQEVFYTYQDSPSGDYDTEPFSDLSWWFANKSIDVDGLDLSDKAVIEEKLWEVINDTPNAI